MKKKEIKEKCSKIKNRTWDSLTKEEQEFLLGGITGYTKDVIYFYDILCVATKDEKQIYDKAFLCPLGGEAIIL